MITIVGKMFNWKNEGLKHKSKSSMFKSQSSKDKKGSVLKPSCKPILLSTQFHKPI